MTNAPMSPIPAALAKLPMFATDKEIAVAIVGAARAAEWCKTIVPVLERRGLPPVDALHKGRPVALVVKFYEGYLGITDSYNSRGAEGKENWDAWKDRKKARADFDQAEVAKRKETELQQRAEVKARSDAWKERKRKALEDFRAKKAAEKG